MKRTMLGVALAFAMASASYGQTTVMTGAPVTPGGARLELVPVSQYVQACNGGLGGFVGQTYSTVECLAPSSGGGSGSNAAAGLTGAAVPTSAGYTGYNSGGNLVGVSSANPLPVNVVSGGAGGGAVFGPTAVGTAAANPPVITGGTLDGTATGAVAVNKVISGVGYQNIAQINGAAPSLTNPFNIAYSESTDVTGTFTNGTQTGNVTATNGDGYGTALVSINGTYATASGTFLASDDAGSTFYSIQCARTDGSALETGYTTLTNTNRQWVCPISGNDSIRVLSSAVATGTVNVRISISSVPYTPSAVSVPAGVSITGGSVGLLSGTQIVGKVGIDQTTNGTTNAINVPSGNNPVEGTTSDTSSSATMFGELIAIKANTGNTNSVGTTACAVANVACTVPHSVAINVSTATTTQLVALSGSTLIYVYGFNVIAGGTGNITFEYGTGTACATGTTVLTGAYPLIAQSGIAFGGGPVPVLVVPAGNALCILTSAAVQMSGSVSYEQQ